MKNFYLSVFTVLLFGSIAVKAEYSLLNSYSRTIGFIPESNLSVPGNRLVETMAVSSYYNPPCALPRPIINGKSPVCAGYSDTLRIIDTIAGSTYMWSTGSTTYQTVVSAATETITVTVTNGNCSHDTTFVLTAVSPNAHITSTYDSVCSRASDTLKASGGQTYVWEPGGRTSTSIVINPSTKITYTLVATDNPGGCISTASVTIGVIKNITSTVHLSQDSICQGSSTALDVTTSGDAALSYTWSTGATTTVILVSPNSTTTYYVIARGICNTDSLSENVSVIPLPTPVIFPLDSVCKGHNDTLTISGGTVYLWSNGTTKTTYIINDMTGDSTVSVIAYNYKNKKCSVHDTVKIPVKLCPVGINEIQHSEQSDVFPNPNNGKFTINFEGVQIMGFTVEIFNVLGQKVYSKEILNYSQYNYDLNISTQPYGVYFYRVIGQDGGLLGDGKVIIQK